MFLFHSSYLPSRNGSSQIFDSMLFLNRKCSHRHSFYPLKFEYQLVKKQFLFISLLLSPTNEKKKKKSTISPFVHHKRKSHKYTSTTMTKGKKSFQTELHANEKEKKNRGKGMKQTQEKEQKEKL